MLPKMNAEHFENQCKLRIKEIRWEVSDLRDAAIKNRTLTYEEKLKIRNVMYNTSTNVEMAVQDSRKVRVRVRVKIIKVRIKINTELREDHFLLEVQ
ncbi:hypothetical protein C2G38_2181073 [Gigaspora rosea]|uniref:Uncharacterized protein n=1 Tax=Gigaspora rosea TaxID=44941 RepID=A0A397VKL8_9GLOM|nr:hypothetical protein C2G38_2181073 [Gigaspora rosea]